MRQQDDKNALHMISRIQNLIRSVLPALCGFYLAISAVATVASEYRPHSPHRTPNVIIILADDLGQGDIGAYGNTRIRTPSIDRLSKNGVMFTNAYASGNVCTPSRAGLMTGQYPIRTGLSALTIGQKSGWGLPKTTSTLPSLLKQKGYKTAIVGKWGLGEFPDHSPLHYGFDHFFGVENSNDMAHFSLYDNALIIDHNIDQSTLIARYTEASVAFIDKHAKNSPFFLYIAHNAPHIPLFPSKEFSGKSNAGRYGDVVEELDSSVGKILSALEQHGILDNTLIIFTSDNGPFFEGNPGPAHGGKGSGWDGGFRVPLIMSWPDQLNKGQVIEQSTMNFDLLPTILESAAILNHNNQFDGKSLLPLMEAKTNSVHDYLYFFMGDQITAIRHQDWKLVTQAHFRTTWVSFENLNQLDGFQAPYDLLFDLRHDPDERYSVADRYPDIVKRLKSQIKSARHAFEALRTDPAYDIFPQ